MFTADQSHLRLDQYLTEKLPDLSRSKIQNLIKLGQVKIDGKAVKGLRLIVRGIDEGQFPVIVNGKSRIQCFFIRCESDPEGKSTKYLCAYNNS